MDKNELARRLMATFIEELQEHVGALNDNLLALEKGPAGEARGELLKSLFRSAHSLKGASRAVNADLIEAVCHQMEDILSAVRDERVAASSELCSLLLRATDAIEEAGMRLREEQSLAGGPLSQLLPDLQRVAGGEPVSAPRGALPVSPQTVKAPPEGITDERVSVDDVGPQSDAAPTATPKSRPAAASSTIRVHAEKLDALLAQSGELLVARRRVEFRPNDLAALRESVANWRAEWREAEKPLRAFYQHDDHAAAPATTALPRFPRRAASVLERMGERLLRLEKDLDQLSVNMRADGRLLGQTCDVLNDEVHRVRMLPFAEACGGLQRAVRDLARAGGKQISLVVKGEEVEIDRSVLEGLKDPLLHLVRNAVDHGIEPPAERAAAGKPAEARITVSAALRGAQVEVVVADDGRGFDIDRIREKVRQKRLGEPQDEGELARMVFAPGFSTAAIVTDVSGRGVGLDVVQSQIESLHGSVNVSFEKGAGTQFSLTLPLTLTTIRCLVVEAGDHTYAIATGNVQKLVRFDASQVRRVAGRDVLTLGGKPVPIASLSETLGLGEATNPPAREKSLAVVLTSAEQQVAFVVRQVLAEQEVLVKNLGARVRRVRLISGATLLPWGEVALVLNVTNVVRSALSRAPAPSVAARAAAAPVRPKRRLLVVEDSLTTRTLMKTILESAGFEVATAVDGQHGLELLAEESFDVVVSDVDMPRVDGFELTAAIRAQATNSDIPVILVTAREKDADKARGIEVGASAYLVKSSFDQSNLLETIEQLL